MSSFEDADRTLFGAAKCLADSLKHGDLSSISDEALQELLSEAVRVFSAKRQEQRTKISAFPRNSEVTATDVSITALSMLKAADLQVFELGLWQSWAGEL